MGITILEKAKQYADKPTHSRYQKDRRLKFESYKDGYTQAITDLSVLSEDEVLWLGFTPREAFAFLIDKIGGKGTWERNPYVFRYELEVQPNTTD